MIRLFVFAILLTTSTTTFSQDITYTQEQAPISDTNNIKIYCLGNDSVAIYHRCYLKCDSNVVFIQLHEDEATGIEAAEEYFNENGGFLVQLKHIGQRLVKFKHQNKDFTVDPNRIFTRIGIRDNMTKLKVYNAGAATQVSIFAKQILQTYVDGKKLIVALHNNTEERFSILSYQKGMPEAPNAANVYINSDMDPDDFILTTDTSIYRRITEKNINVVLQNNKAKDDGSLSIYAQGKKIPYINIEAQHGHFEEQRQMLFALKDIVESYQEIVELNYIENKN